MSAVVSTYLKRFFQLAREISPKGRLVPARRSKDSLAQLEFNFEPSAHEVVECEPSLKELWLNLRRTFFPEREDLDDYRVVWSNRRHTVCLASCSIESRRVLVAPAMNLSCSRPFLEPLIYHEMCHAVLGKPEVKNGRRVLHGKAFKTLEKRHPQIPELNRWIAEGGWRHAVREERKNKRRIQRTARKR